MVGFNSSSLTDRQTGWLLVLAAPVRLLISYLRGWRCQEEKVRLESENGSCNQQMFFFFGGGGSLMETTWRLSSGWEGTVWSYPYSLQTETQGKTINVLVLARTRALRKWRPKVEQQKYAGRCLKWKSIISLPQPRYCWSSAEQKDGTATHIILYIYTCVIALIFISAFEGLVLSPWRLSGVFFQHPILIHFT